VRRLADRSAVLLLLALVGLAGLALDQTQQLQPLKAVILDVVTPTQRSLSQAGLRVRWLVDTARQLERLQAENQALRAEVERLTIENVRLSEVAAENALLREQLQYKLDNPSLDILSAGVIGRVVGRDPSNLLSYLIIDRGSRDGLVKGMPVVTPRGLVGRVTDVGERWAKVLLIIDASSSVNALVQRSRATGVLQGRLGANPVMRYIAQGEDVQVGDIVLTSGLGGNFPKGQVIGQVVAVHQRDIELFQEAEVRPSVDFNRLEMVIVIRGFQPTTPGED